ncbi:HupE/UreJ family protein [Neptunicella sp. SCSIO 80796]|uniref:HupE/UreJ family protein n=1 Tax=Neptunicella plasticusilytica TaxID=3117012 RepID=UPI003A4DB3A3
MQRIILGILMLFSSFHLAAHQMSTAYMTANMDKQGNFNGDLQVRLFDLEQAIGLDLDSNGQLVWNEVLQRQVQIESYLNQNLQLLRGTKACTVQFSAAIQISQHFNEGYLLVPLQAHCAASGGFSINYTAIFAEDADHKLLLNISAPHTRISRVISSRQQQVDFDLGNNQWLSGAMEYIYQGILHIWIGTDHILFLMALLLTCALQRKNKRWVEIDQISQIIKDTAWIVTTFTLAHSITLTATAMDWISLNSRWIELGIAVSVLLAALNNIKPGVLKLGWLTFAFGLLHGMGFASVLAEVGLPDNQKLLAVLTFNIGVEIGQLTILAIVIPVLIMLRSKTWYQRYGVTAASLVIMIFAAQWSIERF